MPEPELHRSEDAGGRRDLLKKLAVGSAAVWVAPAIVSAPVAAQQGSGGLTAVPECSTFADISFTLTAPAAYVGTGFFYAFALSTEEGDWSSCVAPTLYPINVSPLLFGFDGFGLTGTADIWIHDGDCVPILSVTGVAFDCSPPPGAAAPATPPASDTVTTTRTSNGDITVTNS